MALVTPSVLISEIANKAGSVVFSRWKGRLYVRKLVTPANPQTAAQTTQRNYLAKVTAWWHDLKEHIKDACDELGVPGGISGFNAFASRNLRDMAAEVDERIMPINTPTNPVADDLVGIPGGDGEIALTWSQGGADAEHYIAIAYEPTDTPAGQSDIAYTTDEVNVDAESYTLTGLAEGTQYNVWLMAHDSTDDMYSIARKCTATSGPV